MVFSSDLRGGAVGGKTLGRDLEGLSVRQIALTLLVTRSRGRLSIWIGVLEVVLLVVFD